MQKNDTKVELMTKTTDASEGILLITDDELAGYFGGGANHHVPQHSSDCGCCC